MRNGEHAKWVKQSIMFFEWFVVDLDEEWLYNGIRIIFRGIIMKGYEEYLFKYMSGSSTHFIIPVYQRNYDWKTENCKQLFDDLVSVSKNNLNSHFFGSIVSVSDPEGGMLDFLIIDGQQRLPML